MIATLFAQTYTEPRSASYLLGYSLFGMLVGGVIGYFIGASKDRGGLGAVLGALLGCLGWIIVAVLPRRQRYPQRY